MKKYFYLLILPVSIAMVSCDKVENAYPPGLSSQGGLNWDLYPNGDSAVYVSNGLWPSFAQNTNTDRNVLIEDFTGHKCIFCPAAATEATNIKDANPGRVYVAGIHTSPFGVGNFQEIDPPIYEHDFTCAEGLAIGQYFGDDWPGSLFQGNPFGAVSRMDPNTSEPVTSPTNWASITSQILSANELKVNIQADVNYFSSTRGVFLHTELEKIDNTLNNELRVVVYLIQDTIQKPQLFPSPINDSLEYVHHHVMRGTVDGFALGQILDATHSPNNDEKYYFNYSYELPTQYDPSNMQLLIYVRDAVTEEIYHVIKKDIE